MTLRLRSAGLLLLLAVAACAPATSAANASGRRDRNMITESELATVPSDMNAYEIVQRLRPFWLNIRAERSFNGGPAEILAYQGDLRLGGVENLKGIRGTEVLRIEYLDASEAVSRLPGIGTSRPAGAIIVRMRVAS